MTSLRTKIRQHIYSWLPEWVKKNDFEIFAAILSIFGGLPVLLGRVRPTSPESLLPNSVVMAFAGALVAGGLIILVGLVQAHRHVFPRRMFWKRLIALGLSCLAWFCYFYTVCVLAVAPSSGWNAAMIILAFGLISHVRELAIQIDIEEYRLSLGLKEKA